MKKKYGAFNKDNLRKFVNDGYSPKPEILNLWIDEYNEFGFAILRQTDRNNKEHMIFLYINKEAWDSNERLEFQEIIFEEVDFLKVQEIAFIQKVNPQFLLKIMAYLEYINDAGKGDIRVVNQIRKFSHLQLERLSLAFQNFIYVFDLPVKAEDFTHQKEKFLELVGESEKSEVKKPESEIILKEMLNTFEILQNNEQLDKFLENLSEKQREDLYKHPILDDFDLLP